MYIILHDMLNWNRNFQNSLELKSDSKLPKKIVLFIFERPLKMMKNAFHFILKALSVLMIFKFLS